jgi:hypothetical protein
MKRAFRPRFCHFEPYQPPRADRVVRGDTCCQVGSGYRQTDD